VTHANLAREESRTACKICGGRSELFDAAIVLRKYSVSYYRCSACGFLQTETPYWLKEAYSAAITRLDVGILQRNLLNREISGAVLNLIRLRVEKAVDFGAGHGIFVRLMRDRGFDFRWYDLYASNDYARGFEHKEGSIYDFSTAFEVLEHLTDPIADLSRIMELSPNLLVSTTLYA
jgi:2-polyprenyl-3-methyl-5-hydroxy-6-metoxy-1,4-benzoquinol methylase